MVAMTLSLLLIAGLLEVYARSGSVYRTSENIARLQDSARQALSILEIDIRMAGFWGLNPDVERITGAVEPGDDIPAALAGTGAAIDECGDNWAIHLRAAIRATDESYVLPCPAYNNRPQPASDVLVVRHASNAVVGNPTTPRLRIASNHREGLIHIAPCACALPAGAQLHDLIAHAYYVSRDSTGRRGLPALRRKRLIGGATGGSMQDEEIMSGIESLQIQLGIQSRGTSGTPASGVVFRDPSAVDWSDPLMRVVAVRVWLLAVSDALEAGYVDAQPREFPPGRMVPAINDGARRLLVSTTIQLRNARS